MRWQVVINVRVNVQFDRAAAGESPQRFEVDAPDFQHALAMAACLQQGIETNPAVSQAPIFSLSPVGIAPPADGTREALKALLHEVDRNTCLHEETHRGGAIWTFCDGCGRKWADDQGGFQPHVDSPAVQEARRILGV